MTTPVHPTPKPRPDGGETAGRELDENAARLLWLRHYLGTGLALRAAVKAVNKHFKRPAKNAKRGPVEHSTHG